MLHWSEFKGTESWQSQELVLCFQWDIIVWMGGWPYKWPSSRHMVNEYKCQMWNGKPLNNCIILNWPIIRPLRVFCDLSARQPPLHMCFVSLHSVCACVGERLQYFSRLCSRTGATLPLQQCPSRATYCRWHGFVYSHTCTVCARLICDTSLLLAPLSCWNQALNSVLTYQICVGLTSC